ncbi:unnamed protein product, partial [Callosobruchus maculatus]
MSRRKKIEASTGAQKGGIKGLSVILRQFAIHSRTIL